MPPSPPPALSALLPEELAELLAPLPAFRSGQIFRWIARGVPSFREMKNLPLSLREELEGRFSLYAGFPAARLSEKDGTEKLKIALWDGALVEAVLLSDGEGRKTACLSTQAGCPAGCLFCKTGSLGFLRNLDSAEIIGQFFHLRALAPDLANLVIMGMGEPLLNLGELRRALGVLCHRGGLNFSKRRITLSTCGIVPGIRELADGGPDIRLALSLTSADPALREALMPISRGHPLPLVKEALRYYQTKRGRRITLEAVLLGGLNTRRKDADALAAFARGLDTVVNLIPWNPVEGLEFNGRPLREPGDGEVEDFARALGRRGLRVTLRRRKGGRIQGACGQLGFLPGDQGQEGLAEADKGPQDGPENIDPL